jgi:hypothetical protein
MRQTAIMRVALTLYLLDDDRQRHVDGCIVSLLVSAVEYLTSFARACL